MFECHLNTLQEWCVGGVGWKLLKWRFLIQVCCNVLLRYNCTITAFWKKKLCRSALIHISILKSHIWTCSQKHYLLCSPSLHPQVWSIFPFQGLVPLNAWLADGDIAFCSQSSILSHSYEIYAYRLNADCVTALNTSLEWLLKSLLHYVTLMIIIADILCSSIDDNRNAEWTVCEKPLHGDPKRENWIKSVFFIMMDDCRYTCI